MKLAARLACTWLLTLTLLLGSHALATGSQETGAFDAIAHRTFAALLSPHSAGDFFRTHWEQEWLFHPRDDPHWYAGGAAPALDLQLGIDSLRLILDTGASAFTAPPNAEDEADDGEEVAGAPMTAADFKLVQRVSAADGEQWTAVVPLEAGLPPGARPDSRFVLAGLGRGFTLVLNRVNFRHAPVALLCNMLSREIFGFRVQANLYVTPRNSSGFEAHFDWQQAFVLQLAGQKRWTLHTPALVRTPRADMKFKPKRSELEHKHQRRDIVLKEGSLLYLPAGLVHEATTTAAAPDAKLRDEQDSIATDSAATTTLSAEPLPLSVHLTLGVEIDPIFTLQGLLHVFLQQLLIGDSAKASALLEPLPTCACASAAPAADSSLSALRVIDLLHLIDLQLSSQRDKQLPWGLPAHHFRRSLWGLHRWAPASDSEAVPLVNGGDFDAVLAWHSAQAVQQDGSDWQRLSPALRHSSVFQSSAAERLGLLLHELDAPLSGNSTELSAGLRAAIEYAAQVQARRRADAAATEGDAAATDSSPPTATSSSVPSQVVYEFDSVFSDAVLSPWVEPALRSDSLTALLEPKEEERACATACVLQLQQQLRDAWSPVAAHLQIPAWVAWSAERRESRRSSRAADGGGFSVNVSTPKLISLPPFLERPWTLLDNSLRVVRAHLTDSQRRHQQLQAVHLRANQKRAQAYLRRAAAAQAAAAAAAAEQQHQERDL